MKHTILQKALLLIFLLTHLLTYGQNFEGWITYKVQAQNPNPKLIPDSTFQEGMKEMFGEKGYMVQKYFYKKGNYISEMEVGAQNGFQAFNPEDGLLYSWQEKSDTAITLDSRKYMDKLVKIDKSELTDTVLGIPCVSITVKSRAGEMTLWYNKKHFKMAPKFYKGHKYGHWEQIVKEIGCLPLKVEQKGFMTHVIQTMTGFKEEAVEDSRFAIPEFGTVLRNPVN